jgi:uncharacterized protein YegP (UPF0339 family)
MKQRINEYINRAIGSGATDKFEIYKRGGEWRWTRKSTNGNVVGAASEGYKNCSDCIANATRNGLKEDGWELLDLDIEPKSE